MEKTSYILPIVTVLFLVALWGLSQNICLASCSTQYGGSQDKAITLRDYSYEFRPTTIQVNKGDVVMIRFMATDSPQALMIEGYNVKTGIVQPGAYETIQFVADKAGTFNFYSYLDNGIGPIGKLIVTG
jgi:plastocyanin